MDIIPVRLGVERILSKSLISASYSLTRYALYLSLSYALISQYQCLFSSNGANAYISVFVPRAQCPMITSLFIQRDANRYALTDRNAKSNTPR